MFKLMSFGVWFYCKVMNILTSFLCFIRVQTMKIVFELFFTITWTVSGVNFRLSLEENRAREKENRFAHHHVISMIYTLIDSSSWPVGGIAQLLSKRAFTQWKKTEQNEIIQFQVHQREFNLWKKVKGHYLQVVSQIQSNQGRFPFVRTDRPNHSQRNEKFHFNQISPARSVES